MEEAGRCFEIVVWMSDARHHLYKIKLEECASRRLTAP
jgi:hypothetical protein